MRVFPRKMPGTQAPRVGQPVYIDPEAPLTADVVRMLAKQSRDDAFYNKMFTLCLFMAGVFSKDEFDWVGDNAFYADPDLGLYPDVDPAIGPEGVQNHSLVNSRINIQAIVYAEPELLFRIDDPTIREVNQQWFKDIWDQTDLSGKHYQVGLDVEAMGMGFMEWGIDEQGGVNAEPFSLLDCLWDRVNRSPGDWRYFFRRNRLSYEEAMLKYGSILSPEEIDEMMTDMRVFRTAGLTGDNQNQENAYQNVRVLIEWRFWHRTTHCVFLGSINGTEGTGVGKSLLLAPTSDLRYEISDEPGPNPFGIMPVSIWTDSFTPGVKRPVGKTETVTRLAAMLNTIENYIVKVIRRGLPITTLSVLGLSTEDIEAIKNANNLDELMTVIPVDSEDAQKALGRIVAQDIPSSVLQARSMLKEELNAATGVTDSYRGVTVPGQRTAYEVQMNESNGGIQSRHTRKQYEKFIKQGVRIARKIGAMYETKRRTLQLRDGLLDTEMFPVQPFLETEMSIDVNEASLGSQTAEAKRTQRLMEFQTVDLQAIAMGVGDPYKIFYQIYRDLDLRDPSTRMFTPEEMQMMQMQAMMAGAAGGDEEGQGDGNQQ